MDISGLVGIPGCAPRPRARERDSPHFFRLGWRAHGGGGLRRIGVGCLFSKNYILSKLYRILYRGIIGSREVRQPRGGLTLVRGINGRLLSARPRNIWYLCILLGYEYVRTSSRYPMCIIIYVHYAYLLYESTIHTILVLL